MEGKCKWETGSGMYLTETSFFSFDMFSLSLRLSRFITNFHKLRKLEISINLILVTSAWTRSVWLQCTIARSLWWTSWNQGNCETSFRSKNNLHVCFLSVNVSALFFGPLSHLQKHCWTFEQILLCYNGCCIWPKIPKNSIYFSIIQF